MCPPCASRQVRIASRVARLLVPQLRRDVAGECRFGLNPQVFGMANDLSVSRKPTDAGEEFPRGSLRLLQAYQFEVLNRQDNTSERWLYDS
jgi:hypothetical protein